MSPGPMKCPKCGAEMNHHADKLTYSVAGEQGFNPAFGGTIEEMHACPNCGASASRISSV